MISFPFGILGSVDARYFRCGVGVWIRVCALAGGWEMWWSVSRLLALREIGWPAMVASLFELSAGRVPVITRSPVELLDQGYR